MKGQYLSLWLVFPLLINPLGVRVGQAGSGVGNISLEWWSCEGITSKNSILLWLS